MREIIHDALHSTSPLGVLLNFGAMTVTNN